MFSQTIGCFLIKRGIFAYNKCRFLKEAYFKICHRLEAFEEETQTQSTLLPTMITTFGLAKGMYNDQITVKLTMDDLFGR